MSESNRPLRPRHQRKLCNAAVKTPINCAQVSMRSSFRPNALRNGAVVSGRRVVDETAQMPTSSNWYTVSVNVSERAKCFSNVMCFIRVVSTWVNVTTNPCSLNCAAQTQEQNVITRRARTQTTTDPGDVSFHISKKHAERSVKRARRARATTRRTLGRLLCVLCRVDKKKTTQTAVNNEANSENFLNPTTPLA